VWFSEYGLEQTRPFRALKVWMQLRHLGRDGYRRLIAADLATAAELRRLVDASADFELLASGLSVVCFRHRPGGIGDGGMDPARLDPARLDPHWLDRHNRAVLKAVQLGGRVFLAGTTVDGVFALRACIVNPGLTSDRAAGLLDEVRSQAESELA
jgi:glutamate/tyrosine decarboxylase-like PLP-dependent enzyme